MWVAFRFRTAPAAKARLVTALPVRRPAATGERSEKESSISEEAACLATAAPEREASASVAAEVPGAMATVDHGAPVGSLRFSAEAHTPRTEGKYSQKFSYTNLHHPILSCMVGMNTCSHGLPAANTFLCKPGHPKNTADRKTWTVHA